jgi:RNA polymerase sigma-70 factor, ECF subfamily
MALLRGDRPRGEAETAGSDAAHAQAGRRRQTDPPRPGRPRDEGSTPAPDDLHALDRPGFADEALPWMDAVYRFSLRLTRNEVEAEDLVQETYLRAFRSWARFERGTNCRSWLFTICRNTWLHACERASTRREVTESDLSRAADAAPSAPRIEQRAVATESPDEFFDRIVDDRLMAALDSLADEFHDVIVLSDLADLTYHEIGEVLDIPVGTVKSRLFRARRHVRDQLLVAGMEARGV